MRGMHLRLHFGLIVDFMGFLYATLLLLHNWIGDPSDCPFNTLKYAGDSAPCKTAKRLQAHESKT